MRGDADDETPIELGDAFAGRAPDAGAEDEVVALLQAEGLLSGQPRPALAWTWRVAAALVLFAGGWVSSSLSGRLAAPPGPTSAAAGGEAYVLLMWEGADYVEEAVPGARAGEYGAWAGALAGEGIQVSGEELAPERTMLPPLGVADAQEPTRMSGFFILEADAERATELATSHPHRTHGGWVEVRPVVR